MEALSKLLKRSPKFLKYIPPEKLLKTCENVLAWLLSL
jgi:hypothetical protein